MSNLSDKPWLVPGHMYQYDIGWLVDKLLSFETELNTAIDLKTIHYADPIQWDITTQYSPNTVVVDPKTGTAYMSKVPVPSGVLLTNTDYWVVIFNYQRVYDRIMSGVAYNDKDNLNATKDLLVNDLVWYGGDLYRATRAIPQGTTYIPGTNLTPTTIADCLATYYGRDRVAQVLNDTINVSGDYTLNAGDIAETASNVTIHSTQDMVLDADGSLTEQVTKSKTSEVGGKLTERVTGSREIDVDGDDSVHVDGVTSINRGGAVTEVYGSSVDKRVTGAFTESFEGTATSTYHDKQIINSKAIYVKAENYNIQFLLHGLDLRFVSNAITSVKVFGAIGDGQTNDTTAIQNALDSTYDIIVFDAGVYLCDRLNVPSNKMLIGCNAKILANTNNTCLFINKSDGITGRDQANTNITFFGLELSGEKAQNCSLITMGHCNKISVLNCKLHDCRGYHSIAFNSCTQCVIDGCTITNYGGADSTTESIQVDICDDVSSFQWFGPYDSAPTENIKIVNTTIIGRPELITSTGGYCAIGNHLSNDADKVSRVSIQNCTIRTFSRGISFTCGSLIKVDSCFITDCNGGIYLERADNSNVSNCTLVGRDNTDTSTYYIGIHTINTENIIIDSNSVRRFGKTGLLIEGIGNLVANNHVRLNRQFGIRMGMNDQATLYSTNFCFNNGLNYTASNIKGDIMIRIEKNNSEYFGSLTIVNNKATTIYNDKPTRETEPQLSQFCFNVIKTPYTLADDTLKAYYNIAESTPVN